MTKTSKNSWLKTAIAAEQEQVNPQEVSVDQDPMGSQPNEQQAVPNAQRATQQGTQQTGKQDKGQTKPPQQEQANKPNASDIMSSVQVAAQAALPNLNQALNAVTQTILSTEGIGATEDAARKLAIEMAAAWLIAADSGQVSDLGSIVAKSPRISTLISGG